MATDRNKIISLNRVNIGEPILHWHDELELLIVTEGCLELKIGYENLILNKGDIMLVNCDEIHSTHDVDGHAHTISVFIDCNICYDRFPDFYEIIAIWPYKDAFEQLNANRGLIIKSLYDIALTLDSDEDSVRFLSCFDALIKSIIYCYRIDLLTINEINSDVNNEKMDVIYRTIKYIYSNFDHKVNLQEISEQEYMNLFHLSHSFKDITGYTFRDWLNFVRAEHAEKMLLQTSYPLSEIAYRCGFSDVRYLNKHFLKWYNITPIRYRELFKPSYEMIDEYRQYREDVPTENILEDLGKLNVLSDHMRIGNPAENNVTIDLADDKALQKLDTAWKNRLFASISWLLQSRSLSRIASLQNDIGFNNIIIDDMFSAGVNYVNTSYSEQINEILCFLMDNFGSVGFAVNFNENYIYEIDAAKDFISDFLKSENSDNPVKIYFEIFLSEQNPSKDSIYLKDFLDHLDARGFRYVLQNNKDLSGTIRGNSYIESMTADELNIDWLFYKNGFRNNVYYFHSFLSRLYDDVIGMDESYIITKKGEDIRMLIFCRNPAINASPYGDYCVTLSNMPGDYKFVHYQWNTAVDDISSLIRDPKVISHMTEEEFRTLDGLSIPSATFDIIRPSKEDRSSNIKISAPVSSIMLLDLSLIRS